MNNRQTIKSKMNCLTVILALVVFAPEVTRGNDTPQCWTKETNAELYPYIATIDHDDCDHEPHHSRSYGAIISPNYVLALAEIRGTCNKHIVNVGQGTSGKGGFQHQAKLKIIGTKKELALFKLEKPIKFNSLTQEIQMKSTEVKTGDWATRNTAMSREYEGILADNLTAISEQDCKKILKGHGESDFLSVGWFCTEDPIEDCPTYTYSTLVISGELAGFGNNFVKVSGRKMLSRYVDIAQNRAAIVQQMQNI